MFKDKISKVFVGLSGGVDSAVSAALLQQAGYEVIGVFIKIQIPGYPCPAATDRLEAMRVAAHLRIPFREIDLSKEYQEEVFKISLQEFARGRTPNPDTLCNREIKFGTFFEYAMKEGADFVATGHYARREENCLLEGVDPNKDQSYFLWMAPEAALQKTLFPVGGMLKSEVRELAQKFGLPNATRRDSQGLCFLGDVSLSDMISREIPQKEGAVLDESGTVVGKHHGAALYTLGERHGFELFSTSPHTVAHFVVAKDLERNTVTVSTHRFPQHVTKTEISLTEANWLGPIENGDYLARFRYRQKLIPATLDKERGVVTLQEPHYVPLGQSLVLYQNEKCLGGGIIDTSRFLA